MAVVVSSLSSVCRQFGQRVSARINTPTSTPVQVLVGTPAAAVPAESDDVQRLNLFFFRFEPSGFFPDKLPGEPWLLRMHCLVTPFCVDEDGVGAGENDLRVLGEVLRLFQEEPVLSMTIEGQPFLLQAVFCTLGLDQLNQLWSTQGDTVYRPSALFEVSLAPVLPREEALPAPLVGSIGFAARATLAARHGLPDTAELGVFVPLVQRNAPDTRVETWAPALCLVDAGDCLRSASLALGSPALTAFAPAAWVAGAPGSEVTLQWQVWSAADGWQPSGTPQTVTLVDPAIDPDRTAGASLQTLTLPFRNRAGQMLLSAQRSVARAGDGVIVVVRSDPVLITLFEAP
ncbi:MAG: DUF4255 domain-containing protein [Piscinibacter sp.]|nr:DUF4255 domain-containing protein [Piscinibacter sp.]